MKLFVGLAGVPARSSLILIGLTFRTFWAVVSVRFAPPAELVHEALPTRSPLKAVGRK